MPTVPSNRLTAQLDLTQCHLSQLIISPYLLHALMCRTQSIYISLSGVKSVFFHE